MEVIYLQLRPGCELGADARVRLSDLARISPPDAALEALEFDAPRDGRRVDALEVAERIMQARPGARVEVLGAGEVFVSRRNHRRGPAGALLGALMAVFLFCGAALGMTFFHADVNMREAQRELCAMAGYAPEGEMELAVPYALGVFAGVGAFFLLGGRARSPLALKLQDYRKQLEQSGADREGQGQ